MTLFALGAAALFLIALVALWSPLWRYRVAEEGASAGTDEREAQNVALYLEHLSELDAELNAGRISAEQHQKLTGELKRNLLADYHPDANKGRAPRRWTDTRVGRAVNAGFLPVVLLSARQQWRCAVQSSAG